jgi:hypothetical protein
MDILVPPLALAMLGKDLSIRRHLRQAGIHFFQDDMYGNEGLGRVCVADRAEARADSSSTRAPEAASGETKSTLQGVAKGRRGFDFGRLRLRLGGTPAARQYARSQYYRYFPYVDLYAAAPARNDYGRTLQVRPSTDLMHQDCTWGMRGEAARLQECYTSIPIEAAFPPRKCLVRGQTYQCPNQPATVLALLYGPDYATPRRATVGTDYEELDLEGE